MNKTKPLLMISVIQVFKQITLIHRNNQENGFKMIIHILKKENKLIFSIFLEEKIYFIKQK